MRPNEDERFDLEVCLARCRDQAIGAYNELMTAWIGLSWPAMIAETGILKEEPRLCDCLSSSKLRRDLTKRS